MVMPQAVDIDLVLANQERVSFRKAGQMTKSCMKYLTLQLIQMR